MLRIAICDDDYNFTGILDQLLCQEATTLAIEIEIDIFFDGKTFENATHQGKQYDLIYLDIEMSEENGIKVAHYIRKKDKSVLLIYISGYEQYLIELFEVEPFRFLSKPLNQNLFFRYFREAYQRIGECNSYFQFNYNKEIHKIPLRNVVYFESQDRVIHIYFSNGSEERFYGRLNDIEKELLENNQCFLRIHQSFLVNYDYVIKMKYTSLTLAIRGSEESTLHISEDRQKKIRTQLCQLTARKMV